MNDLPRAGDAMPTAGRPTISKLFRLQWEPAQNAHVLLYPEGMVKLNQSAAEILKRCDGSRDMNTLIADLEQAFITPGLGAEVRAFVADAQLRGWLE
ncbi:PqqA binding protein [Paraburkholderia aspalathi]|uniref:PqqA binding protein n=1 Tax=Paraburkholderia aspalathi TaxID=1324617 RepID=A0ABN7MQ51_9BURK|nr:pyrroloquinoline quinone biosynthesis peptide chaperone PqqD [Paraburkholderia aspalathi]MBK3821616.1 pyrroloquinoline quinone biosynthesis peptide chaperone PqqD [Paraburkholderia aspalathi]MBK3833497.1 pyrroloquinoline quinone biosynthesis peptide chaperone PqqD [Paraburkholderia aspalathi]MBK3840394.1 pyrroloquinoline quinone biosynthesis peptide chaperone PqqD [Paraburkholderia aspalathi]MBK3863220.1 pyrroloquinoline quinone biosynthesis peptide chaperone PqqD [Paraburkholderia aspalathi